MKGLVRVKSEGELRPGMTVWVSPCGCGRTHALMLSRRLAHGLCHYVSSGAFAQECTGTERWESVNEHHGVRAWCLIDTIREGRLFRLADEQPTETTRSRERERVE